MSRSGILGSYGASILRDPRLISTMAVLVHAPSIREQKSFFTQVHTAAVVVSFPLGYLFVFEIKSHSVTLAVQELSQ